MRIYYVLNPVYALDCAFCRARTGLKCWLVGLKLSPTNSFCLSLLSSLYLPIPVYTSTHVHTRTRTRTPM